MPEIDYRVRRSQRARRVRVNVDTRGVEVVLPQRAAERQATAAIRELEPWIRRRVRELERAQEAVAARGGAVPYLGELLRVRPEPGRIRVHRRGDELPGTGWPRPRVRPGAVVSAGSARRDRGASAAGLHTGGQLVLEADHPRAAHPLGELLAHRRHEL